MSGTFGWILRYARHSPGAGLYLLFRWVGFHGFRRLEAKVPAHGRILDMGCGHGLLPLLIAAAGPAREVVGVDMLEPRLAAGRRVAESAGLSNVRFECRDFADPPRGRFAAIIFSDALLYYPLERQRQILDDCRKRLAGEGVLLIKEQGCSPGWKALLVRLQERLVVSAKTTLGRSDEWRNIAPDGVHLWNADRLAEFLRSRGLSVADEPLDAWSYLSHYLIVAQNAPDLYQEDTNRYEQLIDAIALEAIWYDGEDGFDEWEDHNGFNTPTDDIYPGWTDEVIGYLEPMQGRFPIFCAEYAQDVNGTNLASYVYTNLCATNAFIPYCTRRSLQRLSKTPYPPTYTPVDY